MSDTSNSPIIKKSDYLYGVKHWVQWFPLGRIPRYEVFVYFGTQPDTGLHWFYARRNPKVFVHRSIHQLNAFGFCAFVLDIKKVDEYFESQGLR